MKSSIANGESRGSINNILLKALQSGDKYGYEINKEIETKSKGKFFLKEASLYSGLKRLQANGYITSYWQDGELGMRRHYYSITQAGLDKLNSSNFTWDDSKTFITEMFKDSPLKKTVNEQGIVESTPVKPQETKQENIESKPEIKPETKKNPFQIEVNPLQQSIFDLALNNNEIKEEENASASSLLSEEKKEEKEVEIKEDVLKEKTEEETKNVLLENKQANKENDKFSQISYEDLLNNYSLNSFSQTLSENKEKVDITKYLQKNKENDENIIINKTVEKDVKQPENTEKEIQLNFNNFLNNTKESTEIAINQVEENKNITEEIKSTETNVQTLQTENIEEKSELKQENNVDIKNIFGSLLVENNQENKEEKIEIEEKIEEPLEVEKPIVKQELPRINVENDINITLNSSRNIRPSANFPSVNQEEVKIQSNAPSVKQYINNVHKKTLIFRATNVEEEVNLDGINIREYRKMNNKVIRNSNYVYKNKLNMFLMLLIGGLLLVESIIAFVILNKSNCLGGFEITLLVTSLLTGIILAYYYTYAYFKDKYKVELKNYNFKISLFYCCLIFVVTLVIFVCVNIFEGMNSSNSHDFVIKIIMELLLSLNIVLYPIFKALFYKVKAFTN